MREVSQSFEQTIEELVKKEQMLSPGQTVLAGVSGGSDSMVMLAVLERLCQEYSCGLRVVHVNHGIRGAESDRDAVFVKAQCEKHGIPCTVVTCSVPELSKTWGVGEEEAGRRVRKSAFEDEARRIGEPVENVRIALAHNQDDVAETVLHHLARGTGLRGIASMRPKNGAIIRPLLGVSKKEILSYAEQNGIPYVTDSTNGQDAYTRNRIRHRILPELTESVNSGATANIARTALLAGQAVDYLDTQAQELLERQKKLSQGIVFGEDFWEQPQVLRTYAIQNALSSLAGQARDLEWEHVQMIESLQSRQTGKRVMLPYGLVAWKTPEGVWLQKEKSDVLSCTEEAELHVPGRTSLPEGAFETELLPYDGQEITEKKYTKWFDYDKIKDALTVRSRKDGDRMMITADGRHKQVRRILIDAKVPAVLRDRIPLVCAGEEVLWIPGIRMSERFRITETTTTILEIRYQGGKYNE